MQSNDIMKAFYVSVMVHEKQPEAIYLGRDNFDRLRVEVRLDLREKWAGHTRSGRAEFNGLPIYIVDEDEFLMVI
jgi:hypothetical protein